MGFSDFCEYDDFSDNFTFKIIAYGKKKSTDEFLKVIQSGGYLKKPKEYSFKRHFCSDINVKNVEESDLKDGTHVIKIEGECIGSIYAAMLDCGDTYYGLLSPGDAEASNIVNESKILNLDIDVSGHSTSFVTLRDHYYIRNGVNLNSRNKIKTTSYKKTNIIDEEDLPVLPDYIDTFKSLLTSTGIDIEEIKYKNKYFETRPSMFSLSDYIGKLFFVKKEKLSNKVFISVSSSKSDNSFFDKNRDLFIQIKNNKSEAVNIFVKILICPNSICFFLKDEDGYTYDKENIKFTTNNYTDTIINYLNSNLEKIKSDKYLDIPDDLAMNWFNDFVAKEINHHDDLLNNQFRCGFNDQGKFLYDADHSYILTNDFKIFNINDFRKYFNVKAKFVLSKNATLPAGSLIDVCGGDPRYCAESLGYEWEMIDGRLFLTNPSRMLDFKSVESKPFDYIIFPVGDKQELRFKPSYKARVQFYITRTDCDDDGCEQEIYDLIDEGYKKVNS